MCTAQCPDYRLFHLSSLQILVCVLVLLTGPTVPIDSFEIRSARPGPHTQRREFLCREQGQFGKQNPSSASSTELRGISALAALDAVFRSQPYAMGALTCGVKASTADLVAQKQLDSKSERHKPTKLDLKRTVAFMIYGALYQGAAQEFIYSHLYPNIFGPGTSPSVVAAKVLFNVFPQSILLTLPLAYLFKALVYMHSPREAMRRHWEDIKYQASRAVEELGSTMCSGAVHYLFCRSTASSRGVHSLRIFLFNNANIAGHGKRTHVRQRFSTCRGR